jgi:hypothetical protein
VREAIHDHVLLRLGVSCLPVCPAIYRK